MEMLMELSICYSWEYSEIALVTRVLIVSSQVEAHLQA